MQPLSEPALVTPLYDAGAVNDFQKDKQFRKLNAVKDTIEIKTLRGGHLTMVTNHDLVVGDVVILDAGDKLVADMLMFESHGLVVDEASLTGESEPIKKHLDSDPWLRSGTQVRDMCSTPELRQEACLACWGCERSSYILLTQKNMVIHEYMAFNLCSLPDAPSFQVSEGSGRALVIAVGLNSEWGKTMTLMEDAGDDPTPLQARQAPALSSGAAVP